MAGRFSSARINERARTMTRRRFFVWLSFFLSCLGRFTLDILHAGAKKVAARRDRAALWIRLDILSFSWHLITQSSHDESADHSELLAVKIAPSSLCCPLDLKLFLKMNSGNAYSPNACWLDGVENSKKVRHASRKIFKRDLYVGFSGCRDSQRLSIPLDK